MEKYQFTDMELSFIEKLPTALAVYQFVGDSIYTLALSQGFVDMFQYPDLAEAYRIMSRDVCYNVHPDDAARLGESVRRFIENSGAYDIIFRAKEFTGRDYHIIHGAGRHVYTESGARLAYVSFTDEGPYDGGAGEYSYDDAIQAASLNRELNKALHEESILRANYYDPLTGLPNMTHFFALAEAGKAAMAAEGRNAAMLYIDLNGMKNYNDNYSFAEGDQLLKAFAGVLERALGNEACCHINADRFAVYTEEAGLEDLLRRIFSEAERLNGGNSLPVRVGIYLNSTENVVVSTACDRAKMACDAIPKSDASCFSYYSDAMREQVKRRQYILSHLDRAISEKWIKVYYQPIVRAVNGRVCDEEALARWIDPVEGFLSPADFIPTLEDAGLIYRLDLYVLEHVLEKMARQAAEGLHTVPHSINLSRSDFDACDIVEEVRRRVDAAGISRDKLTIEITESIIGTDFDFIKNQIERFQSLGFPVWMDDFGSGYSSLDVLQSVKFNLLKFDMSFMRKLDEGDSGKIMLTELMKMATALGIDTVCEGVETESQVHFLQEIGCSKLQGFYYSKALPPEEILERNRKGTHIGYENPEESAYYETIGRVNLYDLGVIANADDSAFQNAFNTLPMGIIEVRDGATRFVRSNQSYRDFIKRFFGINLSSVGSKFTQYGAAFMTNVVRTCCDQGIRAFYDEKMSDGSTVHSFARRIGMNPVTGSIAVAIAVLSISEPSEGESYAAIARSLAADYYNIYVVDLDTERFIEYSASVDGNDVPLERRGEDFFASAQRDAMVRIYEADRQSFLDRFSKETILRELNDQGIYTATYRLVDTGAPLYASLKITRLAPGGNRILIGVSIIEDELRQKAEEERIRQQSIVFGRIAALSGRYYAMYIVDPDSGRYSEYSVSTGYGELGYDKNGDDFFTKGRSDGMKYAYSEDLPYLLDNFSRENIMRGIREEGIYQIRYRLVINGAPKPIVLKAAMVHESDGDKVVVGVNIADN